MPVLVIVVNEKGVAGDRVMVEGVCVCGGGSMGLAGDRAMVEGVGGTLWVWQGTGRW